MLRRVVFWGTLPLAGLSLAGWAEWRPVAGGALVHAQAHFVLIWAVWAAVAALARRPRCALAALAFTVVHAGIAGGSRWQEPPRVAARSDAKPEPLRVMWVNCWGRPDVVDAARERAQAEQADVLALCQVGGMPALRRLRAAFPYEALAVEDRIAVFSRRPLGEPRAVPARADLDPPERRWLRVPLLREPGRAPVEIWAGHVHLPHHAAHASGMRRPLDAGEDSGPAVLLADLNTTPWAADFRLLREAGWQDARAGHWPVPTWRDPARPWLRWPIDHLLVRGGIGVADFRVLDDLGSDHLPLRADLLLP